MKKKIIVSRSTLKHMQKSMIEHLRECEEVDVIALPDTTTDSSKIPHHVIEEDSVMIINVPDKGEPQIPEELIEKTLENIDITILPSDTQSPRKNKPQKKYNVPRTIGKPDSRKKGGR